MGNPTRFKPAVFGRLKWTPTLIFIIGVIISKYPDGVFGSRYHGKFIGSFETFFHNLTGHVYAANDDHLIITNLTYDGGGPRAFFWVGNTPTVSGSRGWFVPYPISAGLNSNVLPPFKNDLVELRLPNGTVKDIRWIAIWCRLFWANFGQVLIPKTFELPKPRQIGGFASGNPQVTSGVVTIKDAKTIEISHFSFDGSARAHTYFIMIGKGKVQAENATKVPNELGSLNPLGKYAAKDIELKLPGDIQFQDVDWLSVYDLEANTDLGHLTIPKDLNDIPVFTSTTVKKLELKSSRSDKNGVKLLRGLILTTPCIAATIFMTFWTI